MGYVFCVAAAATRLINLIGAVAVAGVDRLVAPVEGSAGRGGSAPAVLVHLLAHPGTSVDGLRRVLGISQPAAVRAVDRLAADGLVVRGPGADRRTLSLELTDAGARRARAVLADRQAALKELIAPLGYTDRVELERLLALVVAGLADERPEAMHVCRLCDRDACASGAPCPLEHTVR